MAKLSNTTKAQIISGMRAVRAMDPDQIVDYVPAAQRKVVYPFLTWCQNTGATFGPANIDTVFASFQAAR